MLNGKYILYDFAKPKTDLFGHDSVNVFAEPDIFLNRIFDKTIEVVNDLW